jgi:Bacterial regulatory proteins, tetR family
MFTIYGAMEAGMPGQQAANTGTLRFNPSDRAETSRRTLARERVVLKALAVISTEGAQALSMRALAGRLGVVPGALYRHVRSKEQPPDHDPQRWLRCCGIR